ncbi:hypothetical protein L3V59_36195 [Burkholderia aenigmatica]|uniref:hypothetical protein n=1 Tax=Burkholderia aenigmatica TaxID=2015348 RepID=UPI001F172AAA|nr:hypothetical protein [Burkholderia aenigmatica]UKD17387.1 hypothetical protein L3V59_36195 [Burkholderia aenigmatica]
MPPSPSRLQTPHWRLVRAVVLWTALLLLLAFAANIVGIYLIGDVVAWSQWLDDHRRHLFIWRLCVYAATASAWLWARQRLLRRDPDSHLRVRFLERVALPLAALLELSQWLSQS